MAESAAQDYLELLAEDEHSRQSLLACAAAFRLNDEIAQELIEVVTERQASTNYVLRRIKGLSCVWKQWDDSWYIAEEVRSSLVGHLYTDLPESKHLQIREHLANHAEKRALELPPDGQVTVYLKRQANLETALQRMLIPAQANSGATLLMDVWQASPPPAAQAVAEAVDYLSPEFKLSPHIADLPAEVLFLKGMAARARRDKRAERENFGAVWKLGREIEHPGYVHAFAAYLFALLVRDRRVAEDAFRDSFEWYDSDRHRGQVLHSLGHLLAFNRRRWSEAKEAYLQSLSLYKDTGHQSQVYHSLGNLLSDQRYWSEAEEAYRKSLEIDLNRASRAHTWHSLANLLSNDRRRWPEAEDAYQESLASSDNNIDKAKRLHSFANFLADDPHRLGEAEKYYRQSLGMLESSTDKAQVLHSMGKLLSKTPKKQGRWKEAEDAFRESLKLRDNPLDEARVLASWATLLLKFDTDESHRQAEEFAKEGIRLAPNSLTMSRKCYRVLVERYRKSGEINKEVEALEALLAMNSSKSEVAKIRERITALKRRNSSRPENT